MILIYWKRKNDSSHWNTIIFFVFILLCFLAAMCPKILAQGMRACKHVHLTKILNQLRIPSCARHGKCWNYYPSRIASFCLSCLFLSVFAHFLSVFCPFLLVFARFAHFWYVQAKNLPEAKKLPSSAQLARHFFHICSWENSLHCTKNLNCLKDQLQAFSPLLWVSEPILLASVGLDDLVGRRKLFFIL